MTSQFANKYMITNETVNMKRKKNEMIIKYIEGVKKKIEEGVIL